MTQVPGDEIADPHFVGTRLRMLEEVVRDMLAADTDLAMRLYEKAEAENETLPFVSDKEHAARIGYLRTAKLAFLASIVRPPGWDEVIDFPPPTT